MTPIDETDAAPSKHPDELLWYVSGNLDPDERRRIESHLIACAECRALARTLEPLKMGCSKVQSPATHPGPEELDAFRLGARDEPSAGRALIEIHLRECAACREDLAVLREMDESAPAAAGHRRWLLMAAASLAILIAPLIWIWLSSRGSAVILMPSLRSAAEPSVLHGNGPWRVILVPSSEAAQGLYDLQVERPDGSLVTSLASFRLAEGQESMEVEVPALPSGAYRIAIRISGQDGAPSYVYAFRVASDSGG